MMDNPFSPPQQHTFRPEGESNRGFDNLWYRLGVGCGAVVVLGFLLASIHPLFSSSILLGVPGLGTGLLARRKRDSGILLVSNIVCGVACLYIPTVVPPLISLVVRMRG